MSKVVLEDVGKFKVYLAAQPFCQWSAQKQQEIAMGIHHDKRRAGTHPPTPKNDNSALAEALSSMA